MSSPLIEPVARLIEAFSRLPGIGPKTAQRLTYHLLRAPDTEARALAAALVAVRDEVVFCDECFNISDAATCPICRDPLRDPRRLCIVEEPLDVLAIERTGEWRGRYHVLHGAISPMDGIGPEHLRIRELLDRVGAAEAAGEPVAEVILATNPSLEGDATAMYLAERLAGHVAAVTRIARGLPVGGDLEYADEVTLIRAIQGRRAVEEVR
jgi:recombination protein RecR